MGIFIAAFLPLALAVMMFSLGLSVRVADFLRILTFPKAFAVGAASQLILIPATAYLVAIVMRLPPELAVGLMILSFCPGGPTSNLMSKYAHGDVAMSIAMTGVTTLVSVFTMPVFVKLFADHFLGLEAPPINVMGLGLSLFLITTVPVVIGITLRHYREDFVNSIEPAAARAALGLFIVILIGALGANWGPFLENLYLLGPSVVGLNILLLFIGLALARIFSLSRAEATTIAIETGVQNAALGITVGSLIVEQSMGLPPFSLPAGVYGITMYFVAIPFTLWRRSAANPLNPALRP